ncbi:MAG: type II toxin-antitoxin system RelE/ParE family toxin [Hyphomicrobiales bacterium]
MRVDFSAQSRADLRAIIFFIAADNLIRAQSFGRELSNACASLSESAERHAIVVNTSLGNIHRMPYRNYSIFYQIKVDRVVVIRIVHGALVTDDFLSDLEP